GRTDILIPAGAADGLFHAILHIMLPEHAVGQAPLLFPQTVILIQRVQQADHKAAVGVYQVTVIDGVCYPAAELVEAGALLVLVLFQPVADILVYILRIAQPPAFIDMMAQRAAQGIISACMLYR